jgi:dipeptidyl aminopeptidase/acylaminoacyl peptidase
MRYADAVIDHRRERLVCVREDHTVTGEPANTLISLRLDENASCGEILTAGNDFYSSPRISPDGRHLAWITWNHPNMPWDGTELWLAEFAGDGALANQRLIAGGPKESVVQPEWSPSGDLYFVSDRSGWWNIYRQTTSGCVPVHEMAAEFALPQWLFRFSSYAFLSAELIICSYVQQGFSHLAVVDTTTGKLTVLSDDYTDVSFVRAEDGRATFRGGSGSEAPAIVEFEQQRGSFTVLRRSNDLKLDKSIFSTPKPIEFPTEGNRTAHGIFYPPCNPTYAAPENDLPPLLVKSHGGPTSAAGTALSLVIQYWTSRGVAVLDVNYGGSTGFGRAYRERLKNNWGVVDVEDCVNGARYLVERGEVDPNRLMITGGSAGGYTTLCALTFKDTFKAGASHYGVSDAEALARDTHKFESRYLDGLFGPYPEKREVYFNRSPINFASKLSCPVIFFQGLEDKVVPPNQAEMMVEVLRKKGIAVAYVAFPGEQHGFRQALNIKRSLDAELYFYSRVFGFDLGEAVEPVEIDNLPG